MEDTYRKNKGTAGLDGVHFQLKLVTVFLLNALRNLKGWRISTENVAAAKFDDVVLELSDGTSVLLQAKHKETKRITKDQLFSSNSKNSEFSLPKYFFSYEEIKTKFKVKNLILCTNTDMDMTKLNNIANIQSVGAESILYPEGEAGTFITFNEKVLPILKENAQIYYNKNLQGKGIDKKVISNKNLKAFIKTLQFFIRYPSGDNLHRVIEKLLFRLKDSRLTSEIIPQEIHRKVEDWFKQSTGDYLTEIRAKAMFCEIRSDKYCNKLKTYNVSFKDKDMNFADENRIFCVTAKSGSFLQLLKISSALDGCENKTLYIDPEDPLEVQKHIVEAFRLPKYIYLVLLCETTNLNSIEVIIDPVKEILKKYKQKKMIVVSNDEWKLKVLDSEADTVVINGFVTIDDLAKDSRQRLLKTKNITFQGRDISLEELISHEHYAKALDSLTLEKLAKGEKIRVGMSVSGLNEETARYFVNRTFKREVSKEWGREKTIMTRQETFTDATIFHVDEKIILISDSAGMGKSTILTKLSVNIKEKNHNKWVIRIELNNYTKFLRNLFKKMKSSFKITELLDSKEATKLRNELEKYVFCMAEKVVLMLDGFDEVSPDYTELILNLLSYCRDASNFTKIIVTTRPHLASKLQEVLIVKPFMLKQFTEQNQVDFLTSFWMYHLDVERKNKDKCKKYAVVLIDRMSSWINGENNFAAIPLQISMLAEIFQESGKFTDSTRWEGCREFLNGTKEEPNVPQKMDIKNLYDIFVEKKFDVLIDKASGSMAANDLFKSHFNEYFTNHQSIAIENIFDKVKSFDKRIYDLFSQYLYNKAVETNMLRIGIVQKSNGKLEFIHRTFGEYFAAKCIFDISELGEESCNEDVDFQRFMIDEIFSNPEFTVIRAFFDSFLEGIVDNLPPNIFEYYQLYASNDVNNGLSLIHLLAGEGYVALLKLILKSINFKIIKQSDNESKYTDNIQRYIAFSSMEKPKYVVENTLTFLQKSVEWDGMNVQDETGKTPIHFAAARGHLEMVKFLIENGASLDTKDKEGLTVLHSAVQKGHLDVAKHLLGSGANINAKNNDGFTALTLAVNGGHFDVVKLLIDGDIFVNSRSKGGSTALHLAAWNGNLRIAKFLVKSGVDINMTDKGGFTALHSAAEEGHLDILELLVEAGLDVNIRSKKGKTAVDLATRKSHLETVQYLVKNGADMKIPKKGCWTAL